MVFYRRKRTTRKSSQKRRVSNRMRRGPAATRKLPLYTMRTQKTTYQGTWTFSSASTSGFWKYYEAQAIQMSEFSEFAVIFDEYKITNLKYTFRPRFDSYDVTGYPGANPLSYSHIIKDPASTRIPTGSYSATNINTFLENGGVKSYTNTKPFSVSFKPKVLQDVFGGGTAAVAKTASWIRTTEDGVPHRGFHMFIQNNALTATNAALIFDVFVTYTIQFRGAR